MRMILPVTLSLIAFAVTAQSPGAYPADLIAKIEAMKADAAEKKDMPKEIEGIPQVTTEQAYQWWKEKKAIFFDNRVKSQFESEKIGGAEWLFTDELVANPKLAEKIDKSKTYVAYCNGPHCWRSPAAAMMLKSLGYTNVYWYRDGLPEWKKKGYLTE